MNALIWKELRENFKWAMLALLAAIAAVVFALLSTRIPGHDAGIVAPVFLAVTVFGPAITAVLLGLLQSLPETRRAARDFLLHRPAPRANLYWGKVVSGLLLYFLAWGLPLAGAVLWVSRPGSLAAPFEWRMALPALANLLAGTVFYFAALLTGLRTARWHGSRALPLLAAIPCAFVVVALWEFWQALIVVAVGASVLCVAARGSFNAVGQYGPQPWTAKLALAVGLLAGVGVVLNVAIMLLLATEEELRGQVAWSDYALDDQGRIVRITQDDDMSTRITDLAGTPIPEYNGTNPERAFHQHSLLAAPVRAQWPADDRYQQTRRYSEFHGRLEGVLWYWVPGRGRLEGYAARDRRLAGVLGPNGFAPPAQASTVRFEGPLRTSDYWAGRFLAFPQAVYAVDYMARQVRPIFAVAPPGEIVGACAMAVRGEWPRTPQAAAVATRDGIHIVSERGEPILATGYHVDVQRYPNVYVLRLPSAERYYVWYRSSLVDDTGASCIVELDARGHEVARTELPALRPPVYRWSEDPWVFRPVLIGSILASGLITWLVATRFGFSGRQRVGWTAAMVLGGPAMLLTMLALRDWVAREACAACGRLRVVDRDRCAHCGAAFPPPSRDGTEVFEAAARG